RGLIFVVIRFDVILPHWIVLEAVPHQDTSLVGVPLEIDAVEVEYFAFLKFAATPDRGKRGHRHSIGTVGGALPENDVPVFLLHGLQMINHFEEPGYLSFGGLLHFLFHAVDDLFDLRFDFLHAVWPIHARDVGSVVQTQG